MYSDVTLLAQAPSSVHQPISNFTPPCDNFLGKRCTTLNHCVFDLPIKHLDNNARPFKRQKLAVHVNTRHMAPYYSNSVSHDQCGTLAVEDLTNLPLSIQESQSNPLESTPETDTMEMEMEVDIPCQNTMGNTHTENTVDNFPAGSGNPTTSRFSNNNTSTEGIAKSMTHAGQQPHSIFLPKKSPIVPPKVTSTLHSNRGLGHLGATASTSQTTVKHVDIKAAVQMERVQRWTDALKHIQDARTQLLWFQLFGDELTSTSEAQTLLELLMDIDKHKNLVTFQEEQTAGLVQGIDKVLEIYNDSRDGESIRVANGILSNFYQRFHWIDSESDSEADSEDSS